MRVAQVGTFDLDNLGDLLFPLVFERLLAELADELRIPIDCTCFSPQGMRAGELYRDQRASLPLEQLESIDAETPFDLIFIGGGDIIRDDDTSLAPIYGPKGSRIAFSHLSSPIKAADRRLVLLMPGVPFSLSPPFNAFLSNSFRRLRFAAVRDRFSAARLAEIVPPDVRLAVLPDMVSAISHFYPRMDLLASENSLVTPALQESGYICFQAPLAACTDVNGTGEALRQLEHRTGLPVVLVEIGKCMGDDRLVTQLTKRFSFAVARPPDAAGADDTLLQKVAVIAGSRGFIGTSLHGVILAHAYGVPHFCFSGAMLSKVQGFYATCATGTCYPNREACFAQLDTISERITAGSARSAEGIAEAPKSSDHARISRFIRKAVMSARLPDSERSSGFLPQADLRYRNFHKQQQRSLEARISNLHIHALARRYPRFHVAMCRAVKLLWWSATCQLARKYRERRECAREFSGTPRDHALAVPFSWAPQTAHSAPSVGVICHMYFDGMAQEFKGYLANIPFPFDLWITTDTDAKRRNIESVFRGWSPGQVQVRIAENRGRDIAPKLITCADVHSRYEYVLHIHTKHSPYGARVSGWRKHLLDTLVGSPEVVASIFEVFRSLPDVGMIAPRHLEGIRSSVGWGLNQENAEAFCRRFALNLDFGPGIDFPSGSMFWARSAALAPLLTLGLTFDDFAVENGQTDGTLAHAIERLYFPVCEAAGYDWIKIARPDLLRDENQSAIGINTPEELRSVVADRSSFSRRHSQA